MGRAAQDDEKIAAFLRICAGKYLRHAKKATVSAEKSEVKVYFWIKNGIFYRGKRLMMVKRYYKKPLCVINYHLILLRRLRETLRQQAGKSALRRVRTMQTQHPLDIRRIGQAGRIVEQAQRRMQGMARQ